MEFDDLYDDIDNYFKLNKKEDEININTYLSIKCNYWLAIDENLYKFFIKHKHFLTPNNINIISEYVIGYSDIFLINYDDVDTYHQIEAPYEFDNLHKFNFEINLFINDKLDESIISLKYKNNKNKNLYSNEQLKKSKIWKYLTNQAYITKYMNTYYERFPINDFVNINERCEYQLKCIKEYGDILKRFFRLKNKLIRTDNGFNIILQYMPKCYQFAFLNPYPVEYLKEYINITETQHELDNMSIYRNTSDVSDISEDYDDNIDNYETDTENSNEF